MLDFLFFEPVLQFFYLAGEPEASTDIYLFQEIPPNTGIN
jgi:hypothetical protein